MSKRLTYERFVWFHRRIKGKKYPNAGHLMEEFEITERTARRDIEFMRDRLLAPLQYVRAKRGYMYSNDSFELPSSWITENNVLSLALAVRLASTIPDQAIKDDLCRLIDTAVGHDGKDRNSCLQGVTEKISVKNIEYAKVNDSHFHLTFSALLAELPLRITYHSPHSGTTTTRTIQPLHLMHYMGSWHLLAWCTKRNGIRDFSLSRLQTVESTEEEVNLPQNLPPIKEYTRRHFGIMQGETPAAVSLRFSPRIAPRVLEQVWHPEQQTTREHDGSLLLTFPTADFRELTKIVLGYGAEVHVVAPPELHNQVREEIGKMAKKYGYCDIE